MPMFRRQKIPKKRRRKIIFLIDSLEGKMAKGKKKSKAKEKGKSKVEVAPVDDIIPIATQLSRKGVQYIQLASVIVESESVFRSVTKEITREESGIQRPVSVHVPGLGRIIPIPGSEPVTVPLCRPQCSGTDVPVCYKPADPCCPVLEKELYLDPEPAKSEETEESDIVVEGYNPKPPKIVLGKDGEPTLESDSDSEPELVQVLRPLSPPIVHITPPTLMQRNEFLYHVHVINEDGLLEVDRLDENHPLPNCRLREIEIDNEFLKLFPGGYLKDTCCSDVFDVNSTESLESEEPSKPLKLEPELPPEPQEPPEPLEPPEPEPAELPEPEPPRVSLEERKSSPRKSRGSKKSLGRKSSAKGGRKSSAKGGRKSSAKGGRKSKKGKK